MLKTKAAGWELFCSRLTVPPYLLWTVLPGHERYQRALKAAERASYDAEEFLQWRERMAAKWGDNGKRVRPFTAEREADDLEATFRERVRWWQG
jgi:hypothetical protein